MPKKSSKLPVKKAKKQVVKIVKKEIEQEVKKTETVAEAIKAEIATTISTPKILQTGATSKMSKLIELVKSAENGLTLKQLSESLKWQPHTTRSALSRLNKTHNVGIVSSKAASGSRVYQLAKKEV
jgi:sugar-specific transcriptional regulator TrmB